MATRYETGPQPKSAEAFRHQRDALVTAANGRISPAGPSTERADDQGARVDLAQLCFQDYSRALAASDGQRTRFYLAQV